MSLVALEFLVRIEIGVGVRESDDKTHRHEIVLHVIEEGPAVGVCAQGPPGGVNDESRLVSLRFDLPEFLQTDAVRLWVRVRAQAIALHQLLAQMAATAFSEEDVFAPQLDPRLVLRCRPAVASDAHVDRKSTRLNSSHSQISYAVFCLKKKIQYQTTRHVACNKFLATALDTADRG